MRRSWQIQSWRDRLHRGSLAAILLVASILVSVAASAGEARLGESCDAESDLLQVQLVPGADIDTLNLLYGTTTIDSLAPLYLLRVPPGSTVSEILDLLALDSSVIAAEPAYLDETPEGKRQMMVAAVGGTFEDYVDQSAADRVSVGPAHVHGTGEGVLVAVIDTGVAGDHPALVGFVRPGVDYVDLDEEPDDTANGLDDDADGFIDDAAGHGTMIAGIIRLVAPGAEVLPVRVLNDEGHGLTFHVAKAIRYAVDQGADVINLSLGLECTSHILEHEIARADSLGVVLVAAAGNDDSEEVVSYPASDDRTLSVAALDSLDLKAEFSSYHESVSLSAPGTGILAPFYDGEYAVGSGTSFATPWIAGQAALVRGFHPGLDKAGVEDVCVLGVDDIHDGGMNAEYLGKLGSGRVNLLETWAQTPVAAQAPSPPASGLVIHPNPSLESAPLLFRLPDTWVGGRIEVFAPDGRLLRTLASPPGAPVVAWKGRDTRMVPIPSGVYFTRLRADDGSSLRGPKLVRLSR